MKAHVINPDKTITAVDMNGLDDMQKAVGGYIEAVDLTFGTLWVNEEFLLGAFGPDDVNWIASDLAGIGGRQEFLFSPILGPVFLTGHPDGEGETQDITEAGKNAIRRIAREAGGTII